MKGYFKHFDNFTPISPTRDPNREGVNSKKEKKSQNIFQLV